VIQELAGGAVDIVIGTHRLVQDDVVFKDLGLVVVDEEQRFGVRQKEQFKRLRRLVDVLSLSATPIPRTLHLALMGARAMSTIETPPHDRLPVETIVIPYDEKVIRDAILRELNRQGQVFFLHNRVTTIEVVAQHLKALVPQARIVVGHGQMDSDDRFGALCDRGADCLRREVLALQADVRYNRRRPCHDHGARSGDESSARHNHLVSRRDPACTER